MSERGDDLTGVGREVNDDREEPRRAGGVAHGALPSRTFVRLPVDGVRDGFHDRSLISCRFLVPKPNVLPCLIRQNDRASIWFDDRSSDPGARHPSICAALACLPTDRLLHPGADRGELQLAGTARQDGQASSDETVRLIPPRPMSLEQALEFIREDECVEVTPASVRLRKVVLEASKRQSSQSKKARAMATAGT